MGQAGPESCWGRSTETHRTRPSSGARGWWGHHTRPWGGVGGPVLTGGTSGTVGGPGVGLETKPQVSGLGLIQWAPLF